MLPLFISSHQYTPSLGNKKENKQLFICHVKSVHPAYTAQTHTHTCTHAHTHTHPSSYLHTHYAPPLAKDEDDLRASISQEAVAD